MFWRDYCFPTPNDRLIELLSGKVGAVEAMLRSVTLLLTGTQAGSTKTAISIA